MYKNWLALSKESAFEIWPFVKYLDYNEQAIGDAAETKPQYRRLGIFQYAIANNIKYAHQMGKSKLLTYVTINNVASRKAQEHSGLTITHRGYHMRLFYIWDFYQLHPMVSAIEPAARIAYHMP